MERTEEYIMKLPREIADEIRKDAELQENDENTQLSSVSTERLCDYIVLKYFPERIFRYKYFPEFTSVSRFLSEFADRVVAASFDEIMALCEFINSREKLFDEYDRMASLALIWLFQRDDKEEIINKFDEAGGFELLNKQNKRENFVQLLQKS